MAEARPAGMVGAWKPAEGFFSPSGHRSARPGYPVQECAYMGHQQLFYSVAAINALFASLAWCLAKPNRTSILSVVVFAVIWPFADAALEGRVLVALDPGHAITESDLLSVLAITVAAVQAVRLIRGIASRPRIPDRRSLSSTAEQLAKDDQPLGR